MDELTLLKEFLRENDYLICAEVTENGCIVVFPESIDREEMLCEYEIDNDILNGQKLPKYAIRTFIMCSIFNSATIVGYDPGVISFNVDGEEVCEGHFMDNILIELTEDESRKEAVLGHLIARAVPAKFDKECYKSAKKMKVLDGYNVVKSLFS